MIRLELTDQDFADIAEALDDPATLEQNKTKLLVIRMHHEGAKHGFIAKVLNLHANTITNHLEEYSKGGLAGTLEDRYYADFSAFCGAIDKCLDNLSGPLKEELTSLMILNFQFFQNHKS